jgi:hypothetical protein
MIHAKIDRFEMWYIHFKRRFVHESLEVSTGEWQSIVDASHPANQTYEFLNVALEIDVPLGVKELQDFIRPNLPWAEQHFGERVNGIPWNPPPSASNWPFAQKDNAEHKEGERFSHTYPERFWPKYAGDEFEDNARYHYQNIGIRYDYGDLGDVVNLLRSRPLTRQAYLPVWFPEDTGSVQGVRVPCTLGYHFLLRQGKLNCVYDIRSCDYIRHFKDDIYMAARLMQWIAEELPEGVTPGNLLMNIHSLHIFHPDLLMIQHETGLLRGGRGEETIER